MNEWNAREAEDECRLYMAARRRALESLRRYALECEAANYHLMMCMHSRNWVPMTPRARMDPRAVPYPEDMEWPALPAQPAMPPGFYPPM